MSDTKINLYTLGKGAHHLTYLKMRIKTRQFLTYLAVIVCFVLFISMYMMMNNIDEAVPDLKVIFI